MAGKRLLILLLVVTSKAAGNLHNEALNRYQPTECTEWSTICLNCTTALYCSGAGANPIVLEPTCDKNNVCEQYVPLHAGCVDYTGPYTASVCDCDIIGNRGFLADPYDPSSYIQCIPPDIQYFLTCPEGQVFSDESKRCIQQGTTTPSSTSTLTTTPTTVPAGCDCNRDCMATIDDSHIADPTCQNFSLSFDNNLPPFTLSCPDGEAFDIGKLECVPACELAPPPFTCPEEACGAFPDTIDCTIFHVCLNGETIILASGTPCQEGHIFDPVSMMCVDAATSSDVVCPEVNPCWLAHCDACNGKCPAPLI